MNPWRVAGWVLAIELALAVSFGVAGATGNISGTANASTFASVCTTDTRICLPACAFEDGNTDGLPCLWVDPDTGDAYLNDSAVYRPGTPVRGMVGGAIGQ